MTSIGVSLSVQQGLVAPRSGNARALLNEIAGLAEGLAAGGEGGSIDLRSMPLTEGDLEELHQVLGAGAIDARIDALGESRAQETRYPGIWWVTHRNEAGDTVAELIEVCTIPAILRAPAEDVADGAVLLRQALDNLQESR
jgi:hydrogenase-1 operon protein HyaF